MFAGGGNEVLFGNRGQDSLFGDIGNDQLYGNRERDFLNGGRGQDTLVGGLGEDRLTGDLANAAPALDTFVLQRGLNYRGDEVTDFQVRTDRIGLLIHEFPQLDSLSFRSGTLGAKTGTWIVENNTDMMFLTGVIEAQITAAASDGQVFRYVG